MVKTACRIHALWKELERVEWEVRFERSLLWANPYGRGSSLRKIERLVRKRRALGVRIALLEALFPLDAAVVQSKRNLS